MTNTRQIPPDSSSKCVVLAHLAFAGMTGAEPVFASHDSCYGGYAFPDMVRMSSCPTGGAGRGRSLSRTCCFLSRPVVRFQVSFLEGPDDFVGPSYPFNKLFFFSPANSSCQGGGLRGGPEATLLYVTGGGLDVPTCRWAAGMLKGLGEEAFRFPVLHVRSLDVLVSF